MSISRLLHSYPQLDKRSKIWELNIFSPFLERLCLYAVLSLNRRACSRVQSEWCRIYLPALSQSLKSWNVYHRVTISDCDFPRMPCWGKVECLWKRGRAILWSPYDSLLCPEWCRWPTSFMHSYNITCGYTQSFSVFDLPFSWMSLVNTQTKRA